MKYPLFVALATLFLAVPADFAAAAPAPSKDCAKARQECRAQHGGVSGYRQNDRNPNATYPRFRECMAAKGCK